MCYYKYIYYVNLKHIKYNYMLSTHPATSTLIPSHHLNKNLDLIESILSRHVGLPTKMLVKWPPPHLPPPSQESGTLTYTWLE